MAELLNKKSLEHLAALARIDLKSGEEEKLLSDLQSILNHFKELQEIDTSAVEPMAGGTQLRSVVREDTAGLTDDTGKGADAFPDANNGYLKVPPVF